MHEMKNKTYYLESDVLVLIEEIKTYNISIGYLNPKISSKTSDNEIFAFVHFIIYPGKRYMLRNIIFESENNIPDRYLRNIIKHNEYTWMSEPSSTC